MKPGNKNMSNQDFEKILSADKAEDAAEAGKEIANSPKGKLDLGKAFISNPKFLRLRYKLGTGRKSGVSVKEPYNNG